MESKGPAVLVVGENPTNLMVLAQKSEQMRPQQRSQQMASIRSVVCHLSTEHYL